MTNLGIVNTVRIVVAEDHPVICDAIITALSDVPDFEVVGSCRDGATAVELVLAQRPDIVVMDGRLPVLDGLEATRRILTDWSQARIIIHTAADPTQLEAARASGAVAVVAKCVNPERTPGQ